MKKVEASHALVVGMEASGKAAAAFLRSHGVDVTAADLRPADANIVPQTDELFDGPFDLIVTSPGVPYDLAGLNRARARGVRVIGEVEL